MQIQQAARSARTVPLMPAAGTDIARIAVETIYCDDQGMPVMRRSRPLLAFLRPILRRVSAARIAS